MSDLPNREIPGKQIDLSRLGHPHADAFRHIADALGARYAGDEVAPEPPSAMAAAPDLSVEALPQDPRAAALLETLPLPVLVTNANRIAYLNRRAKAVLGYDGAAALEAAGGLAALFGERRATDGTLAIADALGKVFRATVEMTPIDWAGRRAVMVSMQPVAAAEAHPAIGAEALGGLIDANPDPIAVITRGGRVETANTAYAALADGTGEDMRLEQRLEAEALHRVLRLTAEAFASADGAAAMAAPVRIGARTMIVSAGILRGAELACLVFHPEDERATSPNAASPAADTANALERAAATAGGLIEDDAVRISVSGGPAGSLERALEEETERFFRALLVAIGGRAPAGSTVAIERRGGTYGLSLTPANAGVLEAVAASARLILLGLEAGLAVAPADESELTIAPVLASALD